MNKSATRRISLRFWHSRRHTYISLSAVWVPFQEILYLSGRSGSGLITSHATNAWRAQGITSVAARMLCFNKARVPMGRLQKSWAARAFSTSSTRVESTNFVLSPPLDNCFKVLSLCFALGHLRRTHTKGYGHTAPDWEQNNCPPVRLKLFACRRFET